MLVTFNVSHFARIHAEWMRHSLSHAGIVVSAQRSIGDLLRRLLHLGDSLEKDDMQNRLEFLSDW